LRKKVVAGLIDTTADVQPLRTALAPRFFGAGGPKMVAAGVEQVFDLTQHSVIGFAEVFKNLFKFKRLFNQLVKVAIARQPDVIIGVDYGGFNLRFAKAIKKHVRAHRNRFNNWNPKVVQFVSPQVWASRAGRAYTLAENHDLLLSIFPFEQEWYAQRVPKLRVEFVGHPMIGRSPQSKVQSPKSEDVPVVSLSSPKGGESRGEEANVLSESFPVGAAQNPSLRLGGARELGAAPRVVLLPGSRVDEVRRHWPILVAVFLALRREEPNLTATLVLPNSELKNQLIRPLAEATKHGAEIALASEASSPGSADDFMRQFEGLRVQTGNLATALAGADLAITKSGTVTMECALQGVPAVVFYRTSWPTYFIGKQIVTVKYLAMPNLIADEPIYPEFVQQAATPENIAAAALELLRDVKRRTAVQGKLAGVMASLGKPGAPERAADAILSLLP
jgi:lipid-A-disaccharide synthase